MIGGVHALVGLIIVLFSFTVLFLSCEDRALFIIRPDLKKRLLFASLA